MKYEQILAMAEGERVVKDYIYVKHKGKLKAEHRIIAEEALGRPIPAKAVIHHVDEDKHNNCPTNLVICPTREYHAHLHNLMIERAADYQVLSKYPWLLDL